MHRRYIDGYPKIGPSAEVLEHCVKVSGLRNAMWTVSNFFRGAPKPNLDDLRPALPVLTRHLYSSTDAEVLTEARSNRSAGLVSIEEY